MEATVVTDSTFEQDVIKASHTKPVLVDFWAAWCGPCRQLSPLVEQIATEKSDVMNVAKVDVDANNGISNQYGIQSIPTLILFKNGKPVKQMLGYMPKEKILDQIKSFL